MNKGPMPQKGGGDFSLASPLPFLSSWRPESLDSKGRRDQRSRGEGGEKGGRHHQLEQELFNPPADVYEKTEKYIDYVIRRSETSLRIC